MFSLVIATGSSLLHCSIDDFSIVNRQNENQSIVQICTLRSLAVDWINFVTYGTMHTVHFWTL